VLDSQVYVGLLSAVAEPWQALDDPKGGPWRFSSRPTTPLWKVPFAELLRRTEFGNSGHSRESTDDWNKFATERLHPNVANWNCRPIGAGGGFLGERPVYLGT
jgi:hypothetical protein